MVVDARRTQSGHSPLFIDGSSVEIVKSTQFLGVHLAENLTWSLNTSSISKKAASLPGLGIAPSRIARHCNGQQTIRYIHSSIYSSNRTSQMSAIVAMLLHHSKCFVLLYVSLQAVVFYIGDAEHINKMFFNTGDAEHISKATVCRTVRKVRLALKRFLHIFMVFPEHKPLRAIKEDFHRIA
ncbi:hypothetical protein QTP70_025977, partial [Hemibagrus guttatus]